MAARASLSKEDLLCPLCHEVFSFPVLLKCGHNSCKICLAKLWESRGSRECPVCGTVSASERPPIDLALKITADAFREQRAYEEREERCPLHKEKLKLFCLSDQEPICLICNTSKQHKNHECCPIEEAVQEKKLEISAKLDELGGQMKILNKTHEQWLETKNYIKTQADETANAMKEDFDKLHQFLWEEERVRVARLRQDEEKRSQVMCLKLEYIEEKIKGLAAIISDIEKSVRAGPAQFLQEWKQAKQSTTSNFQVPECVRDILIDSAQYLGSLKFRIWKKMAEVIQCAPFTMDPNTAQANLSFSSELTSVKYGSKQLVPDNPERCSSRISVLGAIGFTSGKHCWTVDVGQGKEWYIGVVRESIRRKSTIFLKPAEGFWVIGLCNGDNYWAQTNPRTKLAVKGKPQTITVELDYDKGKVVFINAVDSTTIHTFKDKFTERMFPYFSPGIYNEKKISEPLAICPMKITIHVQ